MVQVTSVGADMTITKTALCATILSYFAGFALPANAQSGMPVNFPPASYEGRQFVDNSGCAFVRAGYDGNVTWVPRVTRARSQVCNQTPTFGGRTTVTAAAPAAPAPRAAPKQITLDTPPAPAPSPVVRTSATSAPRVVTAPRPAPQVVKAPASKPIAAEPPRVVRRVPVTSAPVSAKHVRVPMQQACAAGHTSRVVNGKRIAIRCGPQATPAVPVVRRGEAPAAGKNVYHNRSSWQGSSLSPDTRIVPRHLYEERQIAQTAHVPVGYKPAWEDDRLNPYRAVQTVQGYRDTQKAWTNQVPRRLITRANPTQPFPKNLWTAKYRHTVKDPAIAYRGTDPYPPTDVRVSYANQAEHRTAVLSTKGSDNAKSYVEIGVFSSAEKAQAAVSRLASAGLAVRAARVSHNGQTMQRLRVGPFADAASAQAGLSAVHSTGYAQAYIR